MCTSCIFNPLRFSPFCSYLSLMSHIHLHPSSILVFPRISEGKGYGCVLPGLFFSLAFRHLRCIVFSLLLPALQTDKASVNILLTYSSFPVLHVSRDVSFTYSTTQPTFSVFFSSFFFVYGASHFSFVPIPHLIFFDREKETILFCSLRIFASICGQCFHLIFIQFFSE